MRILLIFGYVSECDEDCRGVVGNVNSEQRRPKLFLCFESDPVREDEFCLIDEFLRRSQISIWIGEAFCEE